MHILGVDPGATGALAMIDNELGALVVCDTPYVRVNGRMQINEGALAGLLRAYSPDIAWIERVHAMPKQGVTSAFNFGLAYGIIRGALMALEIPTNLVTPNEWKRHFRLGASKDEARLVACRQFPRMTSYFDLKKDHGRAEAALIALFGAQQGSG